MGTGAWELGFGCLEDFDLEGDLEVVVFEDSESETEFELEIW